MYLPGLVQMLFVLHSVAANMCDATTADFYTTAGYIFITLILAGNLNVYERTTGTKSSHTIW